MIPAPPFSPWIGREEIRSEVVSPLPLAWLRALLDHTDPPWPGGAIPPLAHWLYCLPAVPQSDLGQDGHPRLGLFLPPIPLPRRMWAGGEISFLSPVPIGQVLTKQSVIKAVEHKTGRSGELVFVSLRHEWRILGDLAICETQELVYRERPIAAPPAMAASRDDRLPAAAWERIVPVDPTLLFRFSAATFNSHRIHYDRDYAVNREGYPGLVVHGPLIALMLMDLFLRKNAGVQVVNFRFRALHPIFDLHPFRICGAPRAAGVAELWALSAEGEIALRAELRYT